MMHHLGAVGAAGMQMHDIAKSAAVHRHSGVMRSIEPGKHPRRH
jgi:hypothetical protein